MTEDDLRALLTASLAESYEAGRQNGYNAGYDHVVDVVEKYHDNLEGFEKARPEVHTAVLALKVLMKKLKEK